MEETMKFTTGEYTIPDGYEARIENGKIIVTKCLTESEKFRLCLLELCNAAIEDGHGLELSSDTTLRLMDWLEKQKEFKPVKLNDDIEVGLDRALQIIKDAKGNLHGYQSDDGIYECNHVIQTLERILKNGIEQKSVKCSDSVAKKMFIKALEKAVEQTKKGYELTDYDKHSWWEDFKAYSEIKFTEWSEEDEEMLAKYHGDIRYTRRYA